MEPVPEKNFVSLRGFYRIFPVKEFLALSPVELDRAVYYREVRIGEVRPFPESLSFNGIFHRGRNSLEQQWALEGIEYKFRRPDCL